VDEARRAGGTDLADVGEAAHQADLGQALEVAVGQAVCRVAALVTEDNP
jgi:hypothetical protein